MPSSMYRPKHILEYVLLRGLAWLVNALPHHAAHRVGVAVAALSHFVFRFRVRSARERIRTVFGHRFGEAQIRRIAWQSWRNVCLNAVDLMRMPSLDLASVERDIDGTEAFARLRDLAAEGQGVVLALPHSGSWDMAGVICHLKGLPMFFIARRQKNPLADQFLNRLRGASGVVTVLHDSRLLRGVIRNLKDGMILAILPDVRSRTPGLSVEFLGGAANLGAGMAMFARQTGAPILPVYLTRAGLHRHHWTAFDPIRPDPSLDKPDDWLRMTTQVFREFDRFVRQHPENYFWYNKRWVLDPLPPDPMPPP